MELFQQLTKALGRTVRLRYLLVWMIVSLGGGHLAYGLFLDRYETRLSEEEKEQILKDIALEDLRYNGKLWGILCADTHDIKKKIRALFLSNSVLHYVKIKFDRYMLGH